VSPFDAFRGLSCIENQKKSGQGLGLGGKQANSLQQLRQFPIPTELSFLQRGNAAETKRCIFEHLANHLIYR
jgi:hypothetical protein